MVSYIDCTYTNLELCNLAFYGVVKSHVSGKAVPALN